MKKKLILATLSILFFSDAYSGCLQKLNNDLLSTKKQLKKYDCDFFKDYRKNYKVSFCKTNAPKGWNSYYENKLKLIEEKALKCIG